MANFSERVKELRRRNRMTQEALGKVLGVRQDSISTYENGKFYPEVRNLLALADFFCVSLDYLMGRTDDPKVHQLAPQEDSACEAAGSTGDVSK